MDFLIIILLGNWLYSKWNISSVGSSMIWINDYQNDFDMGLN
jgi:hypothetical protein